MTDTPDAELLAQFTDTNSEAAFAALVERHISLVHSVAVRHVINSQHAQDITQAVFIVFARKAATLNRNAILPGWFYHTARLTAANFQRVEASRIRREQEAFMQSTLEETAPDALWRELSPLLDEAMSRLGAADRDALVLRYFQNKSLSEVGVAMGLEERTAQKRVTRAIEKLRKFFAQRGVVLTATAIAGAVSANSVKAAPVALAQTVTTVTLAKGAAGGTASLLAAIKAAGTTSLLAAISAPLIIIFQNYIGYSLGLAEARSEDERNHVKTLFRKVGVITLGVFIPLAALVLWLVRDQVDRLYFLVTGFVVVYLPTMLALCIASKQKNRGYYTRILAQEHAGIFPKPAWEYRSQANLLGLPLVHIRIGDRFGVLKEPVTAWIAMGNHAIGGLFAFGCITIAPLSIGWLSIGLLSLGGFSLGVFALGGIAVGIWSLFGALSIGWQALGCLAIAWNVADGNFSLAHDFAAGRIAFAAQANNLVTKQVMEPTLFFHCTHFIADHWLWLNLIWMISSLIQWWLVRKGRQPEHPNQ